MKRMLVIGCGGLSILGVILLVGLGLVIAGEQNTGVSKENDLSGNYGAFQGSLTELTSGWQEQISFHFANVDAMNTLITDAVGGRYDHKDAQGNSTGSIDANLFIQAVAEAYPNVTGITDMANQILTWLRAKREGLRNEQAKLLTQVANYNTWRKQFPQSIFLGNLPSENLYVFKSPTQKVYGQEALDIMSRGIISSAASAAVQSGVLDPMTVNPTPVAK